MKLNIEFENYVNYAGSKTASVLIYGITMFENYVNYAGSKTSLIGILITYSLRTM